MTLLISVVGAIGDDLNVNVPQHPQCYDRACPTKENCGGEKGFPHSSLTHGAHLSTSWHVHLGTLWLLSGQCRQDAVPLCRACGTLYRTWTAPTRIFHNLYTSFPCRVSELCFRLQTFREFKKKATYNVKCFVCHVKTTCKTISFLFAISNNATSCIDKYLNQENGGTTVMCHAN